MSRVSEYIKSSLLFFELKGHCFLKSNIFWVSVALVLPIYVDYITMYGFKIEPWTLRTLSFIEEWELGDVPAEGTKAYSQP